MNLTDQEIAQLTKDCENKNRQAEQAEVVALGKQSLLDIGARLTATVYAANPDADVNTIVTKAFNLAGAVLKEYVRRFPGIRHRPPVKRRISKGEV